MTIVQIHSLALVSGHVFAVVRNSSPAEEKTPFFNRNRLQYAAWGRTKRAREGKNRGLPMW